MKTGFNPSFSLVLSSEFHHSMQRSPSPSPEPIHSHWNALVVSMVGVVCTIFLLVSYYTILKHVCCLFRRVTFSGNWDRVRAPRQLLNEGHPGDLSIEYQSRGLDFSIMHSLPITQFVATDKELNQSNAECAVCLGEFEEGEWLKHLPNCTHSFHVACIDTWFQCHSNCPLCRSHVYDIETHNECSISMHNLLETLRREEYVHERAAHYQIMRSEILQDLESRNALTAAH